MATRRLAALTPAANTETELITADLTAIVSVVCTNTQQVPAEVTVYVRPANNIGNASFFSYIAANLPISPGQSFETFRFPIDVGDVLVVQATTASINFSVHAVFDNQGGQNVIYSALQPTFPNVGDIWVSSSDQSVSLWTGSSWNAIALNAPAGPQGPTGPQGPAGNDGLPGINFNLLGSVALIADLPAFGTLGTGDVATDGLGAFSDAYYVDEASSVYIWTASGWQDAGAVTGPEGPTGPQGIQGPAGTSINISGTVATQSALPTGASQNDTYLVQDVSSYFVWTGTEWVDVGDIAGPQGPAGPAGPAGADGADGAAATVAAGTTTTGAAGTNASVTNSGTTSAAVFDFTIPAGADGADGLDGAAASIAVGTTTTGAPGSSATVTNSGTSSSAIFDFTIPEGEAGVQGPIGPTGPAGPAINAIATLDVANNLSSAYTFNSHYSGDNPTVYALGGATLAFDLTNVSVDHPFLIQENSGAGFANITTGIIHVADDGTITEGSGAQGQTSGTVYWEVPITSTSTWQYICSVHSAMVGTLSIKSMSTL